MQTMYYIGLGVHKRTISYCVKDVSGRVTQKALFPPHALIWIDTFTWRCVGTRALPR
jgi:hypothetical protein